MKCPNCGLEIPDDHMYCDHCGAEINIVPDFDPEVENEINATLSGVAEELNREERLKKERKARHKAIAKVIQEKWMIIAIALVLTIAVGVGIWAFMMYQNKTSLYYLHLAESSRSSGDLDTAIKQLKEGNREHPDNSDIIFRMSDYYLENGDPQGAVDALMLIVESGLFPEDKVRTAYESMISIYKQNGQYDKVAELLESSNSEMVSDMRSRYVPNMPSMSPIGGNYDIVNVSLKMVDGSGNAIYYTVNDGVPDANSIKYESEIVLENEGVYNIKAVSVNEYGICSAVAEYEYVIEKGAPAPPEIMEPSGEYNQNTMIVAVAMADQTIFYTTDGSDPTMESKQYISPITMPVGTSHFKFICYDNDGNCSEIVERDYHLVYSRLVSPEQAVNSLVSTLVRLDILLDNAGSVRGIEGHNEYIYNSIIEIEGAGEYYVVVENHVMNDGTTAPTGLMYAVNTHDGTVNRLGYDSSGKYTLITISNR
jgi:tetratricopeptide (TPR) repeat protein